MDWHFLYAECSMARQKWADFFRDYGILLCTVIRIAAFPPDHAMTLGSSQRISTKLNIQDITQADMIFPWIQAFLLFEQQDIFEIWYRL